MKLSRLAAVPIEPRHASPLPAFEPFQVKDIRVEGIQRTEAGNGVQLSADQGRRHADRGARPPQAIKSLYATGFFKDVRLEADGGVLVVLGARSVRRSPRSISSGSKEFDKDKLLKDALKQIGLAEGRIFDRACWSKPSRN